MLGQNLPSRERRFNLPILEIGGLGFVLLAALVFVVQLSNFSAIRQEMPAGLAMGEINVSGMSRTEAQSLLEQAYGSPITVNYRDESFLLTPDQVGFQIETERMFSEANDARNEGSFWSGFWNYLWRRQEDNVQVDLVATYSSEQLQAWLQDIANRYDSPPKPPQPVLSTLSFEAGQPGYTLNIEESSQRIEAALFDPGNRSVELIIDEQTARRPGMDTLQSLIVNYILAEEFDGVASVNVIDLETGESIEMDVDFRGGGQTFLDCEVPYAATSTMKVPITIDYFRYLDWIPTQGSDQYKILTETLWQSGNISANFMMQDIGFGNIDNGVANVRATAQTIGMRNTFIVAPYDEEEDPEYFSTPAREQVRAGACVDTYADPYMQTTTHDLALALDEVYQCAEFGGGSLIALYPDEITQEDCQMIIELLGNNAEGEWLVMSGVPPSVQVAHKHGYTFDTHGDAAIVTSPGGDYVLSIFLWADVNWLDYSISSSIVEGVSKAVFNYFNPDLVLEPRRGTGIDS